MSYENIEEALNAELAKLLGRKLRLYVVATGAGAGIQQMIWQLPGCSSFLAGAAFPYSPEESTAFAGGVTPQKFASDEFATDLAMHAYMRAIDLDDPDIEPVGLAVTGSVASVKKHRGEHRIHIACMTRERTIGQSLILDKEAFGGAGPQARLVDGLTADWEGLKTLIAALNPGHEWEEPTEKLDTVAAAQLFLNPVFRNGVRCPEPKDNEPLFPGAFNPPHKGHHNIADTVEQHFKSKALYTICTTPPHKPNMTVQEMLRRAKMLKDRAVYFSYGDPLYIDKARQHPGTPIVFGSDALIRMLDPKWGPDPVEMLKEFEGLGTTFAVFGREIDEKFVEAQEAIDQVPFPYKTLFQALPGRWDISSTTLRREAEVRRSAVANAAMH